MDQVAKPSPKCAGSALSICLSHWQMALRSESEVGRLILDGYAIAAEYRMTDSCGGLIVLGVNL